MIHLIDMWLMEFRRILAPGGHALFTIHDEHTWQWLAQHPDHATPWAPGEDFSKALDADLVVYQSAEDASWAETFTFFRTDWVAEEWGRYLDVGGDRAAGRGLSDGRSVEERLARSRDDAVSAMKTLVISAAFPPLRAGEADHTYHVCQHLADRGAHVHVLTTRATSRLGRFGSRRLWRRCLGA